MDFTEKNCENFFGTLSASSTDLPLPVGICGQDTWGSAYVFVFLFVSSSHFPNNASMSVTKSGASLHAKRVIKAVTKREASFFKSL